MEIREILSIKCKDNIEEQFCCNLKKVLINKYTYILSSYLIVDLSLLLVGVMWMNDVLAERTLTLIVGSHIAEFICVFVFFLNCFSKVEDIYLDLTNGRNLRKIV